MKIEELESMKATKIAEERNQKGYENLSDIYTSMIKNAGKCKCYASDILYDIDSFKADLKKLKQGETTTQYIGYRESGTDHLSYILCRDRKEYFHMQKLTASMVDSRVEGYVTIELFDLN